MLSRDERRPLLRASGNAPRAARRIVACFRRIGDVESKLVRVGDYRA